MTRGSPPTRWIPRIVYFRERAPFGLEAVLAIVFFVGVGRLELESLLCRQPMVPSLESTADSVGFYFGTFFLFALLASRLAVKPPERTYGVVAVAIFLGLFPPLIDTVLSGPGTCSYRYIVPTKWTWTLFDAELNTPGEPLVLWASIVLLVVYVRVTGAGARRTLLALPIGYAAIWFIAGVPRFLSRLIEPQFLTSRVAQTSLGTMGSSYGNFSAFSGVTVSSLLFVLVAEVAYLLLRPALARRLLGRVVHAAPYVSLVLLGASLTRLFLDVPDAPLPATRLLEATHALALLQLCVIALVQNDHFDAVLEGGAANAASPTRDDVRFFSAVGAFWCVCTMLSHRPVGYLLSVFLVVSVVYSYDFYRGKRFFPANYKAEGTWGAVSFLLGAYVYLRLGEPVPGPILLGAFLAFGGSSIFNAFKDYKDIRTDRRLGNQTMYVLLHKAGVRLSRAHRMLRAALLVAMLVVPCSLVAYDVSRWGLGIAAVVGAASAGVALGGPPCRRSVVRFFLATTAYFLLLTLAIEIGR